MQILNINLSTNTNFKSKTNTVKLAIKNNPVYQERLRTRNDAIIEQFKQGVPKIEIAKSFNRTTSCIDKILRDAGFSTKDKQK